MAHPIREFLPEKFYLITNNATDHMFLFRPDNEVEQIVGERLVAAAEHRGIEIYAFICLSSHFHAIARAPRGNMADFLRDFEGAVGADLNRKWGRSGGFFARRATAEPILDDKALLDKVVYILANPAASDLVVTIHDWPGLSSAPELLQNKKRTFRVFRRRAWHAAGRPKNKSRFVRDVEFKHAVLPMFAHLAPEERAAKLAQLLAAREKEHAERRAREGKGILGRERILRANWWDRPLNIEKSPRPLCHASTKRGWNAYLKHRKAFLAAYRVASARYLAGEPNVEFPRGSFRPPIIKAFVAKPESPSTDRAVSSA